MALTRAEIWRVASAERSASRCTSSATTEKPRPASPAEAACIAALRASTLVCSVMSEISSVISPISFHDSPPPPGAPGAARRGEGRLYRGIEGQHVGLLGDVGDQFGDFTDLLRGFAQALDALGGVLNLIADRVHAADGVLHRLQTRVRRLQRLARHRG